MFLPHYQRLFKRLITEDIGADLNQGFDTFTAKKGVLLFQLVQLYLRMNYWNGDFYVELKYFPDFRVLCIWRMIVRQLYDSFLFLFPFPFFYRFGLSRFWWSSCLHQRQEYSTSKYSFCGENKLLIKVSYCYSSHVGY